MPMVTSSLMVALPVIGVVVAQRAIQEPVATEAQRMDQTARLEVVEAVVAAPLLDVMTALAATSASVAVEVASACRVRV